MDDKHGFGGRLRDARAARGLTQMDVATAVGTTPTHVSRYESGTVAPGSQMLARLARALDVTADWLLFGDDTEAA